MSCKVYFNNSCSICKLEIDHYKKISKNIDWVDISTCKDSEKQTGLNVDNLYRRMHVIEDGKLISGSKSFLIIWEKIPKYKFLKRIFENPIIFHIFNIFYEIVAYFLYLKSKLKR